jgi:MFS family permease
VAQPNEVRAVYAAGMAQGVALVTLPAASTVFTSASHYGLSSTAYGAMFLPQAAMAIAAALLGTGFIRRWGNKRVYLCGLVANLVSMALIFLSQFVMTNKPLAYGMLLAATACLGIGFGLTAPSLNTFAAAFFPKKVDRAVLILNALLGLGTALAPVLVAVFVGLGFWWGLPVLVAALLLGLLAFSLRLPLQVAHTESAKLRGGHQTKTAMPARFRVFATFALLYGVVETLNGNWATLYMTNHLAASTSVASLALTAFWGMVTAGRIVFAAVEKRFPERRTYHLLPFVAAAAFTVLSFLPTGSAYPGVLAFGLAGVGCSALLPLTISFGENEFTAFTASVAGGLIAFYQIGYGLAAFGVGPLEKFTGMSLGMLYGLAPVVALAMAALSFVVVRPHQESTTGAGPHFMNEENAS